MLSVVKTEEQRRARELRGQGWSIKDIARVLGVSRSSVSSWVRDVPLTPEQRRTRAERIRKGPLVAGERKAARARDVRLAYQPEGDGWRVNGGAYEAGCMLYWAEGAKKRNVVKVTNSDLELLAYFARFLRESSPWPTPEWD